MSEIQLKSSHVTVELRQIAKSGEGEPVWISRHTAEALLSLIDAEPPKDYVLVPVVPTEAMLSAGRTAVMARECSGPLWGAGDHYEAGGYSTDGIPPRLLEGKGKMSKAHCAELAYSAMLAARPETPDA